MSVFSTVAARKDVSDDEIASEGDVSTLLSPLTQSYESSLAGHIGWKLNAKKMKVDGKKTVDV
jgi:hypothetical protein